VLPIADRLAGWVELVTGTSETAPIVQHLKQGRLPQNAGTSAVKVHPTGTAHRSALR